MVSARPQQMSDSQEKSDDLIAELAKLMASNAQGAEPEAHPAHKMAPLSEATIPSPAPIRIPGMTPPASAAPAPAPTPPPAAVQSSATPTIRIPGMAQPVAAAAPAPAAVEPAPAPAPRPQFDFGKPPTAAVQLTPEPMTNWQDRELPKAPAPRPVEPGLSAAPKPMTNEPLVAAPKSFAPMKPVEEARPAFKPIPMTRIEPAPASVQVAQTASVTPTNAPAGDGFDFDFGFGSDAPANGGSDEKPYDPIADLITAELDAGDVEDAPVPEAAKPTPVTVIAPIPASVQPITPAARSLANPSQSPVLVARPTGNAPAARPMTTPAPAKPMAAQARPGTESDRFTVAPVFGLGGKPTPARAEPDPMDEIESLIGEAVRVELSPATAKTPSVSLAPPPPVVPPLNTQFAPRRSGLKDSEPPMQSAEAAILAAAAATGAEVGRVDAPGNDGRPYKRMKVKPPKATGMSGGIRPYIGMAVAGTLLLAAGFGLYWVLGMGRGDPTTAPVLTAEVGSAKQPAPVAATVDVANTGASGVFDQMEGKAVVDSAETLVSRDETAGADVADVARVVGATADETEAGLANRKVRTVTVRPDGTIVPGDEAVAGNEALPVDRPNVPALPGDALEPSDLLATAETQVAAADPIAEAIAGGDPGGIDLAPDPNAVTALVASAPTPGLVIDPTKTAPAPMPRPADRSTLVGGGNQAVALLEQPAGIEAAEPATTELLTVEEAAAPTASTGGAGATAYVQLSSQRSEGEAQASLRNAQSKWSGLLEGNQLEIQRADLGQKGIYYRVRLPASSLQDATSICASIKANGGECFATNG
jgi:hypothetical protein